MWYSQWQHPQYTRVLSNFIYSPIHIGIRIATYTYICIECTNHSDAIKYTIFRIHNAYTIRFDLSIQIEMNPQAKLQRHKYQMDNMYILTGIFHKHCWNLVESQAKSQAESVARWSITDFNRENRWNLNRCWMFTVPLEFWISCSNIFPLCGKCYFSQICRSFVCFLDTV